MNYYFANYEALSKEGDHTRPPKAEIDSVKVGDSFKIGIFPIRTKENGLAIDISSETFWVRVEDREGEKMKCSIQNYLVSRDYFGLYPDDIIEITTDNIFRFK